MAGRFVMDASALVAFLRDEEGSEVVASALDEARDRHEPHLISALNWAEVLYVATGREPERLSTPALVGLLDALPVDVVAVDRQLAVRVAYLKQARRVALADAFAAALAIEVGVPLMTADADFDALVEEGLVVERVR